MQDEDEVTQNLPAPLRTGRNPRLPLKALDYRGQALVEAMVFGVGEDKAFELGLDPHRPLPLELAAQAAGLKIKNARFIFSQPVFLAEFNKALASVRNGHKARAIQTLADIMSDPGNNLAADKAVRVKASSVLLGADANESRTSVQVAVATGGTPMRAGVVIRLKHVTTPQAPIELQAAVDAESEPQIIDVEPNAVSAEDGEEQ